MRDATAVTRRTEGNGGGGAREGERGHDGGHGGGGGGGREGWREGGRDEAAAMASVLCAERDALLRHARAIVGQEALAEEIVQEAFLRVAAREDGAPIAPRAWLHRVVAHLAIDVVRRRRLERGTRERWPASDLLGGDGPPPPGPEERLDRDERVRDAVRRLLDGSGPADVATVLLREVFGTGYAELARASGRREATCRQAVRRALARARDAARPAGDVPAGTAPSADADACARRFERAVLARDPAPLFDALRIVAMASAAFAPPCAGAGAGADSTPRPDGGRAWLVPTLDGRTLRVLPGVASPDGTPRRRAGAPRCTARG